MVKKTSENHPEGQVNEKKKEEQKNPQPATDSGKKEAKAKAKKEKKEIDYNAVISKLEEQTRELQDKYLRLSAEFDNYRKRTLKERADLLKSAGQDTITKVLPVLDDFERAVADATDGLHSFRHRYPQGAKVFVELFNVFRFFLFPRVRLNIVDRFDDRRSTAHQSRPALDQLRGAPLEGNAVVAE